MPGPLLMDHPGNGFQDGAGAGAAPAATSRLDRDRPLQPSKPDSSNAPTSNTALAPLSPSQMDQLPPELPHISAGYWSLSKLLARTSQECFNSLSELLSSMAEMLVAQQSNGPLLNGAGGHGSPSSTPNSSQPNVQKKLKLLGFSEDQRAKFIKLLVITNWSRRSTEIEKLIDLFSWLKMRDVSHKSATENISQLRTALAQARQRNPDLRTALEILSTGKAPWMPDLGFIPPPPLTPQQGLKLLRHMNTIESLRLHLHESLPRHLMKWKVANGRVTFIVPGQFEFDVISYTQDDSQPWVFSDLRFLFAPAPVFPIEGPFQVALSNLLNEKLRVGGLTHCFDFLHNYILTHKITVLRNQGSLLRLNEWIGTLRVDQIRRILMVQYWLDRPGKKSWITVGVARARPKNGKVSWRGPVLPHLAVRWIREGTEVKDAIFDIDWSQLSMETVLKKVIALHVRHILTAARDQLMSLSPAPSPGGLISTISLSETEPSKSKLVVSLGSQENSLTLWVDTVTGAFVSRPQNALFAHLENSINNSKEPLKDIGTNITKQLAAKLHDFVHRQISQLGWSPVSIGLSQQAIKQILKDDVLRFGAYRPHGWSRNWAVAMVINLSGLSWWMIELPPQGPGIHYAERMMLEPAHLQSQLLNREYLGRIARVAAAFIDLGISTRVLDSRSIPHMVKPKVVSKSSKATTVSDPVSVGWMVWIKAAPLLGKELKSDESWEQSLVRVSYHGADSQKGTVRHIIEGKLILSASRKLFKLMSRSPNKDFHFSSDGSFSFILSTPFGSPILDALTRRLQDIYRFQSVFSALTKRRLIVDSVSLAQVKFRYGPSDVADIVFDNDGEVDLVLQEDHPHKLIYTFLKKILNQDYPGFVQNKGWDLCLDRFTATLLVTFPFVRGIKKIISTDSIESPTILPRSVSWYRLGYTNPSCSFDIRLTRKNDEVYWAIEDTTKGHPEARAGTERSMEVKRSEQFQKILQELFKSRGQNWWGTGGKGILAAPIGVEQALQKLHEVVSGCRGETTTISPQTAAVPVARAGVTGVGETGSRTTGEKKVPPPKREVIQID